MMSADGNFTALQQVNNPIEIPVVDDSAIIGRIFWVLSEELLENFLGTGDELVLNVLSTQEVIRGNASLS